MGTQTDGLTMSPSRDPTRVTILCEDGRIHDESVTWPRWPRFNSANGRIHDCDRHVTGTVTIPYIRVSRASFLAMLF